MSAEAFVEHVKSKLAVKNDLVRCMLSEFLGSFILALLADGAVAGAVISKDSNFMRVAVGVGFAVVFAVWTGLGVSGGHVNPAVTLALAASGKFPFKRVCWYFLAQFSGTFVGAMVCYVTYYDGIKSIEDESTSTCSIFTTFPAEYLGYPNSFLDQIVNTGLLMGLALMLFDKRNAGPDVSVVSFYFGILIISIIMSYGVNTGAPLNPARDFTGRILCTIMNNGESAWIVNGGHWWLIPTFGPFVGGVVGAWMYMLFIEFHHPEEGADTVEVEVRIGNDHHDTMIYNLTIGIGTEGIEIKNAFQFAGNGLSRAVTVASEHYIHFKDKLEKKVKLDRKTIQRSMEAS